MLVKIDVKIIDGYWRIIKMSDNSTDNILSDIEDILSSGDKINYLSNLNYAYLELCKQIEDLGYKSNFELEAVGDYCFFVNGGEVSDIKIYTPSGIVILASFEKKFNQQFGTFEQNKKLLDYAIEHNRCCCALGVDAFNDWLSTAYKVQGRDINLNACRTIFKRVYPEISEDMLDLAKETTSGYQVAVKGYYDKKLYHYDIASSYPSQLLNDTPIGEPIEFNRIEDVPSTYFYVVKIRVIDVKIKSGCIDFLSIDKKNVTTLYLTKHLYQLFNFNYTYFAVKFARILAFKTRKDVFTSFIQRTIIDGKMKETDPSIAKYNKSIANSLNGYFGKNAIKRLTAKDSNGQITSKIVPNSPVYLPVYLFTTGKAKAEFIATLQRIGTSHIVYANTDGFYCDKELDLDWLNRGRSGEIGVFKHKYTLERCYINCINGVAGVTIDGTIVNTLSGMTLPTAISVEQYESRDFE